MNNKIASWKYCLTLGLVCVSTPTLAQSGDIVHWGMDVRAQREHQSFDNSDADLNTISLQPYVQAGKWDISLSLPWQSIEGEYFVNGFQPTPSRICQRLNSLTDLQRQLLINRGRVTGEQLDYCDQQTTEPEAVSDSVSGMSDISLFARRTTQLDDAGIWLGSIGLGYKWDNGDEDTGIGSGTRDTTLDFTLSGLQGNWLGYVAVGYVWISGGVAYSEPGDEEGEVINYGYDNYAYATVDGGYKFTPWLTLGASANTQQAYIPGGEDVEWLSAYANVRLFEKFRVRAYVNDYLDIAGYPEQEFGASLTYSF